MNIKSLRNKIESEPIISSFRAYLKKYYNFCEHIGNTFYNSYGLNKYLSKNKEQIIIIHTTDRQHWIKARRMSLDTYNELEKIIENYTGGDADLDFMLHMKDCLFYKDVLGVFTNSLKYHACELGYEPEEGLDNVIYD